MVAEIVAVASVLTVVAGSTSVDADAFEVAAAEAALAVAFAVVAATEPRGYSFAVAAAEEETGDCLEAEADMWRDCTQVVLLPISRLRMD